MPPKVAVTTVEPVVEVAVTSPCEPAVLLMSAIPVSDEAQVTEVVIFRMVLLE